MKGRAFWKRHQHYWIVVGSSFTPPQGLSFKAEAAHGDISRLIAMMDANRTGETHVYLRCEDCGDISHRTVPGEFKAEMGKPMEPR